MKLYVKLISENETQMAWDEDKELGSEGVGWYELKREPEANECFEYNPELDVVEIKQRVKSAEQLQAEQETQEKAEYIAAMPDLVKTLCTEVENLKSDIEKLKTKEVVK